jgi:hypothetical protein
MFSFSLLFSLFGCPESSKSSLYPKELLHFNVKTCNVGVIRAFAIISLHNNSSSEKKSFLQFSQFFQLPSCPFERMAHYFSSVAPHFPALFTEYFAVGT